jgi:citrate lyase beta subunit
VADIAFAERVVGVFARAVGGGSAAIQVDGKLIGRHP